MLVCDGEKSAHAGRLEAGVMDKWVYGGNSRTFVRFGTNEKMKKQCLIQQQASG